MSVYVQVDVNMLIGETLSDNFRLYCSWCRRDFVSVIMLQSKTIQFTDNN